MMVIFVLCSGAGIFVLLVPHVHVCYHIFS